MTKHIGLLVNKCLLSNVNTLGIYPCQQRVHLIVLLGESFPLHIFRPPILVLNDPSHERKNEWKEERKRKTEIKRKKKKDR